MATKKVLSIGLAAAVLAAGCATIEEPVQGQEWKHSLDGFVLIVTRTLYHRGTRGCMVYATVTNQTSSDIKGGLFNYSFFNENGVFESSAIIFIHRGLPAWQTVVYETRLNDSSGTKYYPYGCPKLQKLTIEPKLH